jgi:hypothetical protein
MVGLGTRVFAEISPSIYRNPMWGTGLKILVPRTWNSHSGTSFHAQQVRWEKGIITKFDKKSGLLREGGSSNGLRMDYRGRGKNIQPTPETIVTIVTNVMGELADDDDNSKGLRVYHAFWWWGGENYSCMSMDPQNRRKCRGGAK